MTKKESLRAGALSYFECDECPLAEKLRAAARQLGGTGETGRHSREQKRRQGAALQKKKTPGRPGVFVVLRPTEPIHLALLGRQRPGPM